MEVLRHLDADVLALQEAALPPGLSKGGLEPPEADVEALQRGGEETQAAVLGHEGLRLLEGLRDLGYTHCAVVFKALRPCLEVFILLAFRVARRAAYVATWWPARDRSRVRW